jgi:hypothetical protein
VQVVAGLQHVVVGFAVAGQPERAVLHLQHAGAGDLPPARLGRRQTPGTGVREEP